VYDLKTLGFLAVNDAMVNHYGYSRDELLTMKLPDINLRENRDALLESIRTVPGKYRRPGVWSHKKKDGIVVSMDIMTSDIEFDGRKARLTLGYDVTERLKAEESLIESENKLRDIANTVTDAIILINNDWKITYCNSSTESMFLYTREELLRLAIPDIVPPLYRETTPETFRAPARTAIQKLLGKTYELKARKKEGAEFPVEVNISEVHLKDGWHCTWVIRDITQRQKLEGQLRQAQKMEAIGQLAGGVAHDFNNILTAIMGYGNLIRAKMTKDDPLLEFMENILVSVDRAAKLTKSLLAFSRQQVMDQRTVDANDIIRQVEKLLGRVIGEDIELKTTLTEQPVSVHADIGQIEQVILNLATNARDAMPQGGSLAIETDIIEVDETYKQIHGFGEAGTFVRISVSDTGMGMDEKTTTKIFDPFFTTKEVGKGTGLGLSMAYGIIKQHKGYIDVISEPGSGTIFSIYLPLIRSGNKESIPSAVSYQQADLHGTETVLIVEDYSSARDIMRRTLEEFGYTVYEAKDGEDAIQVFTRRKEEIQMAVIDMILPKRSGAEVYGLMKKMKPDIKAVFVSGYRGDKIQGGSLSAENQEFMQKPFTPTAFMKKIREILDRKV
jgi:PAS domain S-box-containing protein